MSYEELFPMGLPNPEVLLAYTLVMLALFIGPWVLWYLYAKSVSFFLRRR